MTHWELTKAGDSEAWRRLGTMSLGCRDSTGLTPQLQAASFAGSTESRISGSEIDLKEAAFRKFSGPVPYFFEQRLPASTEPNMSYQVGFIAVRQPLSGDQKKAVTLHFSSPAPVR